MMFVRKFATVLEETKAEMGIELSQSFKKVVAIAVIKNPYTKIYQENLSELFSYGEELGTVLTLRALEALNIPSESVQSYGKAAIVGIKGEIEHAAAILHPKFGTSLRNIIGGGQAIIPSVKKIGYPGCTIDVPLFYRNDAFLISHIDAIEIRLHDSPREDEILVAVALTDSGRPFPRS